MKNIGDKTYGLSIDGDVIYTIPLVEAAGELAERFCEGFKKDVIVLDVTNSLPVGIGWRLDGDSFVGDDHGQTIISNASSEERFYAFIADSVVFGMIRPILSNAQKEMLDAAFATGGVIGVDVV